MYNLDQDLKKYKSLDSYTSVGSIHRLTLMLSQAWIEKLPIFTGMKRFPKIYRGFWCFEATEKL